MEKDEAQVGDCGPWDQDTRSTQDFEIAKGLATQDVLKWLALRALET